MTELINLPLGTDTRATISFRAVFDEEGYLSLHGSDGSLIQYSPQLEKWGLYSPANAMHEKIRELCGFWAYDGLVDAIYVATEGWKSPSDAGDDDGTYSVADIRRYRLIIAWQSRPHIVQAIISPLAMELSS